MLLALYIFQQLDLLYGLLVEFTWVLGTLFTFRIFVGLLYSFFDAPAAKSYHHLFVRPLLIILIIVELLSRISDMGDIANIVLITLASIPFTIRAVAIATVGLYFWTMATRGVEDVLYLLATRYTRLDPGNTQAVLTLGRYVFVTGGVIFALSQFQLDAATVAAITGGLSIGIGFGLREILSNFLTSDRILRCCF